MPDIISAHNIHYRWLLFTYTMSRQGSLARGRSVGTVKSCGSEGRSGRRHARRRSRRPRPCRPSGTRMPKRQPARTRASHRQGRFRGEWPKRWREPSRFDPGTPHRRGILRGDPGTRRRCRRPPDTCGTRAGCASRNPWQILRQRLTSLTKPQQPSNHNAEGQRCRVRACRIAVGGRVGVEGGRQRGPGRAGELARRRIEGEAGR